MCSVHAAKANLDYLKACCGISAAALWVFWRIAVWQPVDHISKVCDVFTNETTILEPFVAQVAPTGVVIDAGQTNIPETTKAIENVSASVPQVPSGIVLSARAAPSVGVMMQERGESIAGLLSYAVYANCEGLLPYVPVGYVAGVNFDDCWTTRPHEGDSCIRFRHNGRHQWARIAWQDPPNNRGDLAEGYDLQGPKWLSFRARGKNRTEREQFKIGLVGRSMNF